MSEIFISHSSEDAILVTKFVELLVSGIGVPPEQVFCSSIPGNILPGRDFRADIKSHLEEVSLVMPIMSSSFNASRFCMFEIGASWALSKSIMPVLVPPFKYDDMTSLFAGTHGVQIDSSDDLSVMRDAIIENLDIKGRSTAIWESNRRNFIRNIKGLMNGSQIWLYVLVSRREEGDHEVVGCIKTQNVPKIENAITATGRAYWISPKLSLRGEWTTDESLFHGKNLNLHYTMKSPPDGEILNVQKPETHEGIIRLQRRDDFSPLIGDACYSGYVHDLFGWSDNTPSIYAEPVKMSWDDAILEIETKGIEIYKLLSKRLGIR